MHKFWAILFAVVNLAALGLFLAAPWIHGWWLPSDVSSFGYEVDQLFYLILYTTGFFFVLTEAILVYCMWRYYYNPARRSAYSHGNHRLEVFWTSVTAVILLVVAFSQVSAWDRIKYYSNMPEPTHIISVTARQFEWRIRYPSEDKLEELKGDMRSHPSLFRAWSEHGDMSDIRVVNEVHTWKGAKVRVMLKTQDVLHSFFLPNLRLKQDAVPGKTIPVWFEPIEHNVEWDEAADEGKQWKTLPGKQWPLACAELCGWGHYKMQGRLLVHKNKDDYDRWLSQAAAEQNSREAK